MNYCLGIDAGGTYTDAVIMDKDTKKIISSGSALTTYPDPIDGIRAVLDILDSDFLSKCHVLSVSTTLATNTILENTGEPAALIAVGESSFPETSEIEEFIVVAGGHDHDGTETEPLDLEAVKNYVLSVKDRVSAFAVSSFFSIRNPEHEIRVKELIEELTGYPVICGHELAQSLGAYERGVTAYLNATLLPVTKKFMMSVQEEMNRRKLNIKTHVLKCNGSIWPMDEAIFWPVESVFSGPAASLLGAGELSGLDTYVMIDIGGTSTDVSMQEGGYPHLDDSGAIVGNWKTKVNAIKMETSAMGGDSHIWIRSPSMSNYENIKKINIGPMKVVPLCRASSEFPKLIESAQKRWFADRHRFNSCIQPTIFFMRTDGTKNGKTADSSLFEQRVVQKLSEEEMNIFNKIGYEPTYLMDIIWDLNYVPVEALQSMLQKKIIRAIGFTPTDVLHVLGEFNEWDSEISHLAAELLSEFVQMDKMEFCLLMKKTFATNIAKEIVYFLSQAEDRSLIDPFFEPESAHIKFKSDVPVIMIGGPVRAYADDVRSLIDTEVIVPPFSDVGNAVGALSGKVSKKVEIVIRLAYSNSRYGIRTKAVYVYTPSGRQLFNDRENAESYAQKEGKNLIFEYMKRAGIEEKDVFYNMQKEDIVIYEGIPPVSTKYIFEGHAEPKI